MGSSSYQNKQFSVKLNFRISLIKAKIIPKTLLYTHIKRIHINGIHIKHGPPVSGSQLKSKHCCCEVRAFLYATYHSLHK